MNLYRQTVSMKSAPQLISYINFCAAGIHVRVAAQLQQRQSSNASGEAADIAASSRRYELKALRQCLQDFEENQDPNPGVAKAKNVISNMAERAGILHLLQSPPDQGGLSPMLQDQATLSTGANSNGANGHVLSTENAAQNAVDMRNTSLQSAGGGGALQRVSASDNDLSMGITPPYEVDFEAILASFDPFEPSADAGHDGLFLGNANAATNSDILFGFLRDYDPPSAAHMNGNDVPFT